MRDVRYLWILGLVEFVILTVVFLVLGYGMAQAAGLAVLLAVLFVMVYYAFVRVKGRGGSTDSHV